MCMLGTTEVHTGDASRDDNDVGVLEGLLGAVVGGQVASDGLKGHYISN